MLKMHIKQLEIEKVFLERAQRYLDSLYESQKDDPVRDLEQKCLVLARMHNLLLRITQGSLEGALKNLEYYHLRKAGVV